MHSWRSLWGRIVRLFRRPSVVPSEETLAKSPEPIAGDLPIAGRRFEPRPRAQALESKVVDAAPTILSSPSGPAVLAPGEPHPPEASSPEVIVERRKVSKRAPAPTPPPKPKRRRRLNIGIDFGTSTTKVCARERLGISAGVPFYPIALSDQGELLCPSVVSLDNDRLYFGFVADEKRGNSFAQLFPHLKVCMACSVECRRPLSDCAALRDAEGNCSGTLASTLAAHELVALFLAWVMGEAKRRRPKDFMEDVEVDFTFNIGVPVGHLDTDLPYERTYRWVGHCAELLSDRVQQGLPASEAAAMIAELRSVTPPPPEQSTVQYCPEAQAAIISHLASPEMGPGLYGLIDVGAWTTDVSFFRRVQLVVSDDGILTLEYYAADSHRVAVNDIDELVVRELRDRVGSAAEHIVSLLAAVRGQREEGTFGVASLDGAGDPPSAEILSTARNAVAARVLKEFRRTLQAARTKEIRLSEWEGKLQLFVVGGGAAETSLWIGIGSNTPVAVGIRALPSSELSHDVPVEVGPRFAVAVGLAIPSALWPRVFLPSSIPPAMPPPVKRLPSFEDLGYGK